MKLFKTFKKLLSRRNVMICTILGIVGFATLATVDVGITVNAKSSIYTDIDKVPHKKVAVVLGTIKYVWGGRINHFYKARIDAAVKLYKHGKVDAIIVSGDNSRAGYDEPTDMRNDLIARGVPAEHVHCDFAGFRTLDSIVRTKAIFDCDDYIIVSQKFHCERAIFIADSNNHQAIGFCAKDVGGRFGLKVRLREVAARVKAVLDCYVLNKEPKFYGPKVPISHRKTLASNG